jgi:tRNA (guanine-N7-)-methyltransferase
MGRDLHFAVTEDAEANQPSPQVRGPQEAGPQEAEPARSAWGITARDLPPLPDDAGTNPVGARLDPRQWFPKPELPFEIEIGSGKGTFLVQQAEVNPGVNYLGIEWAGEFYRHAVDRCERRGLQNVRLLYADAVEFLRFRVPDGVVRTIHLYFSDPWPKNRHHKNRVVQDKFLADAARVLPEGGLLRIVTDHEDYWAWMEEYFARWTAPQEGRPAVYERLTYEPVASAGAQELVGSNFERKYRREGRPFHAAVLRKR